MPVADPPVRLSSSQVSLILQRAAEIDARGDTLTVDELRRIAGEAGIDPEATVTAIQEVVGEDAVPVEEPAARKAPAKKSALPSPHWIVTGGALGVAIGFIISLQEPARPLAIGGALVYLILRAIRSMKLGAQLDFQLQNFVLWLGVAVGGWASEMFYTAEVFMAAFMAWFITSVLGGILVQFGPREEEEGEPAPPAPAALPDELEDPGRQPSGGSAMPPSQIAPPQGG